MQRQGCHAKGTSALQNLETLTLKRTRVKQSAAERLRPLLPNLHSLNC